jgi:hypothetical protein
MILFWKYDVDYHCLKQQFELAIFFQKTTVWDGGTSLPLFYIAVVGQFSIFSRPNYYCVIKK